MASSGMLPRGLSTCCSIPDLLFLPELIFGGLVWILVASTKVVPYNPQAYVIAVSLYCFLATFLWMIFFLCGIHQNRHSFAAADVVYHGFASLLYISASVLLAYITIVFGEHVNNPTLVGEYYTKEYKLDIAAVVFSFMTTLLYIIHTILSARRWRHY